VQPFRNAAEEFASIPFCKSDYFSEDSRTVSQELLLHKSRDNAAISTMLLQPLFAPRHYGELSNYHTISLYRNGLDNP